MHTGVSLACIEQLHEQDIFGYCLLLGGIISGDEGALYGIVKNVTTSGDVLVNVCMPRAVNFLGHLVVRTKIM